MRQVLKRCNRRILKNEAKKQKNKEKTGRAGSIKKPCTLFLEKGSCMYGDRCKYLHITMDQYEEMLKEEKMKEEAAKTQNDNGDVKVEESEIMKVEESGEGKTEETEEIEEIEETEEKKEFVKEPEEGQLCHMLPLLTHEVVEGYRNKCSFTIGLNKEGQPTVGFRMGSFIEGNVCIGEIE